MIILCIKTSQDMQNALLAACQNAGKALCTQEQWERACRGSENLYYPYGDDFISTSCNGFLNYSEEKPSSTGSLKSCGSSYGVYDLSGNVEEWIETATESVIGSGVNDHRLIRGGSYASNKMGLACTGDMFHAAPAQTNPDRGFRCCMDVPDGL